MTKTEPKKKLISWTRKGDIVDVSVDMRVAVVGVLTLALLVGWLFASCFYRASDLGKARKVPLVEPVKG